MRVIVVTRIPARVVISSGGSVARCGTIPSCLIRRGDVISIAVERRTPHSAAAARWLRTAPGPPASTAAIHRARIESTGCPTA